MNFLRGGLASRRSINFICSYLTSPRTRECSQNSKQPSHTKRGGNNASTQYYVQLRIAYTHFKDIKL